MLLPGTMVNLMKSFGFMLEQVRIKSMQSWFIIIKRGLGGQEPWLVHLGLIEKRMIIL